MVQYHTQNIQKPHRWYPITAAQQSYKEFHCNHKYALIQILHKKN